MRHEQTFHAIDHIWIELTQRCNLTCEHCYSNSGPTVQDQNPLNESDYFSIIEDGRRLGATSIQFIGGEPMLSPALPSLLLKAREAGYDNIEVYSNLVSVPSRTESALLNSRASIATSLYSDKANEHDAVTHQQGSFNKTVGNVKRLIALGLSVRVGVIKIGDDVANAEAAQAFAISLGVHHVSIDHARPFGRLAPQAHNEESAIKGVCGHCWNGKICVDPSGNVSPCIMSKTWTFGSVRGNSLLDLVANGAVQSAQMRMSDLYNEHVGTVKMGCDPEDRCDPGACKPRYDGPDKCSPKNMCAPQLYNFDKG